MGAMNNNQKIRKLIDKAYDVMESMELHKRPYNFAIDIHTKTLMNYVEQLSFLLKKSFPAIGEIQRDALSRMALSNGNVNAYSFGTIKTTIEILDSLFPYNQKKIFISHSSADKEIVKAFVEKILMLGCGFDKDDIFCTLNSDAINIGDDFRNSIIDNMRCCDYIFLMISENYRNSEICHNEVGAAWALQNTKRVIPLKFPNLSFSQEDLGVLNVVKQAGSLNNKQQITKIYEELCEVYDINPDFSRFVQYADEFIEIVNKQKSAAAKGAKAKETSKEIMDSLSDFDKKRLLEWVKSGESSGSCTTTADGTFYELGTVVYPINTGREKSEYADFIERLRKINFVKFTGSDDFSYYYELKKAAYDYVDKMHT